MNTNLMAVALASAFFAWTPSAHGQLTTERFIPVGRSPGISGVRSYIGDVERVEVEGRTCTVSGPQGSRTIKVTTRTRIWLDRSEQRLPNTVGTLWDLQPGRRVEVRYVDDEAKGAADWIKVVVTAGG